MLHQHLARCVCRDDGQDGDGNATGTSILSVIKEPSRSWLKGSKSTERVLDS
jgi:hypothetical protein